MYVCMNYICVWLHILYTQGLTGRWGQISDSITTLRINMWVIGERILSWPIQLLSTLMLLIISYADMFRHIGFQATTTENSSYMIYQSYWQSEHECGTCMMVFRAVRDVLNNTYHDRWIRRGWPTAWPPRSTPDLTPLYFHLWQHLKTLVYAAPVDNEKALHIRIVDACQTIRNYPGIFERMRPSMMRHVEECTESHGGHFEHLL
jgi:hypothetical protein